MPIKDKAKKLDYQRRFYQENKQDQLEKIKARRYRRGVKPLHSVKERKTDDMRFIETGSKNTLHNAKILEIVKNGLSLDSLAYGRNICRWYDYSIQEIKDRSLLGSRLPAEETEYYKGLCETDEGGHITDLRCFDFSMAVRRLFANLNEYDELGPVKTIGFIPDAWAIYRYNDCDAYHFLLIEVVDHNDIDANKAAKICDFADILDQNYHDITVLRICAKTGTLSVFMALHMAKEEITKVANVSYDPALNGKVYYVSKREDISCFGEGEEDIIEVQEYANEKHAFGLKPPTLAV